MKFRISGPRFQVFLRARFALGFGAVLLPFLVAAAVGQFYLLPRLIEPLNDIVREITEEMVPVVHLQMALLQAAMPVNGYLINGDPGERWQFVQLGQRVERAFEAILPERFLRPQERASIGSALADWKQAQPLGEQLLRLASPVGNAAAARDMNRFDAHIDRAVSALDEAHDFRRVIEQSLTHADTTRIRALWATFAAFVLAAMVSLFAGATLVRPLLAGLGAIDKAIAPLAAGDLSARAALDGTDGRTGRTSSDSSCSPSTSWRRNSKRTRRHCENSRPATVSPDSTTTAPSTCCSGTSSRGRSASSARSRCCCSTSTTSSTSTTRTDTRQEMPFSRG